MIIICHYDEIALKGGNREYFEKMLVENIKKKIKKYFKLDIFWEVKKIAGRIIIQINGDIKEADVLFLKDIFGIANFSIGEEVVQDVEVIKKNVWKILKGNEFKNFRITASRSDKNFPLNSEEINRQVGSFIVKKSGAKVNLKNPEVEIFIEITNRKAFIYKNKIQGGGGLPVNCKKRVLVLISGGIDSPVAAYFLLKRGAGADFIHFHSLPYTSQAANDKVEVLVKKLNKFQDKSKIFFVPLAKIQEQVMMNCPEKLRVILYRRMMMRLAEIIAKKNNYLALVTGEVLSQVASQTLENILVTNDSIELPIFRPLIGLDKKEIMFKAKEIGTYNISVLPHEDCCTRFVPKHPETKADLLEIRMAEEKIDTEELIKEAVTKIEVKVIN